MKWFKHYTNAHKGRVLQHLSNDFSVNEAYALYFRFVEYLSDKWDGHSAPEFTVNEVELKKFLTVTQRKLDCFLTVMQLQLHINFKKDRKLLHIHFPKLLEILHKDAISSKNRPASGPPVSGPEEEEKRTDKKVGPFFEFYRSVPMITKEVWQKNYGDAFIQEHGPEAYAFFAADPKSAGWNTQGWASRIGNSFKRTQEHLAKQASASLHVVTDSDVQCGIAPDV